MSWKILNEIVGLAAIDHMFCQQLLQAPLFTIDEQGYQLTEKERDVIENIHAANIREFCEQLLERIPQQ